jgi:leucyl-tRNA synthetase
VADKYIPSEIEPRWQQRWEQDGLYTTDMHSQRPKYYFLTMYPYPSGDMHTGHWYAETPADTKARYLRMKGYNVFFPYGFDAFGLPAENAAIKRGIHPFKWTMQNIENMRRQARRMGTMFDWSREVITCLPEYYKWNQWFFLQFYKQGLAYRQRSAVDWCPNCNTTLAREQVIGQDRRCERCDTPVTKRDLEQWFFRITKYADELLNHEGLDWPERIKTMQNNWIGRSEGARVTFMSEQGDPIEVFTTRPDTLWGATFMVLAPEHPLVAKLTTPDRKAEVEAYVAQVARETEIDREATDKEKTGVFIGAYAINPVNGERIPIWIADYVLMGYGTGAIMAVPAHDQRDFEFARTFNLPIRIVVQPPGRSLTEDEMTEAWPHDGVMVNSGPINGIPAGKEAGQSITETIKWLEANGKGPGAVNYRLRDWLISRQRYWGTPIPIIYCAGCGTVPVPEHDLPVLLPEDAEFLPTGESPLKRDARFYRVACPQCGRPDATRETDTMDTFVDSSWYQYRYLSPHYDTGPFDPAMKPWLPVDQYTGGVEHAILHLLYFRFFTKAMRDMGLIDFGEPALRLMNQGIILGPDGEKMSKSRGNVVNPEDYVDRYGADTFRCYLMFIGPWTEGGPYRPEGIEGIARWLNRIWNLAQDPPTFGVVDEEATRALHRLRHMTVKEVEARLERFEFNTMIAKLMEYTNALMDARQAGTISRSVWDDAVETLVLMLAPAAPHIAEELWARMGKPYSIHQQPWPSYDPELAKQDEVTVVVQVNGKVRDRLTVPATATEEQVREQALASERVRSQLDGKQIARVIYVPGRLLNVVLK